MPITNDIRARADEALEQGRKAVDQAIDTAQAQLTDVSEQANEFVGKLAGTARGNVSELRQKAAAAVTDLRAQAEKRVDLDSIKAAVEPYFEQARGYAGAVSDRAEELLATARKDERVARLLDSAESITGVVVDTVQERVVKPVQKLTGVGATAPARTRTARPTNTSTAKPSSNGAATAKPATSSTAKPTAKATSKTTAKPAVKSTAKTTARKAPASKV